VGKSGISAKKACTFAVISGKTAIPAQNNCIFAGIVCMTGVLGGYFYRNRAIA